jgi:hypothetical protein
MTIALSPLGCIPQTHVVKRLLKEIDDELELISSPKEDIWFCVYQIPPIDFWEYWLTEKQFKANITKSIAPVNSLFSYRRFLNRAKQIAQEKLGWPGDIAAGPFIAALAPTCSGDDGRYMIAWKESNNGTTYIASPIELPWIKNEPCAVGGVR